MADRYGIFPPRTRKKIVKDIDSSYFKGCCAILLKDWSSVTAGQARALGIHAMKLAGRSHGARWGLFLNSGSIFYQSCTGRNPKILHIKTLIHQVLAEGWAFCVSANVLQLTSRASFLSSKQVIRHACAMLRSCTWRCQLGCGGGYSAPC